ncbi:MAG: metallophosphoesterase [Bacteroidota bacterium]
MKRWAYLLLLTSFLACEKEAIEPAVQEYLFLGHIYEGSNRIDERVEAIHLDDYAGIWLGGDVCVETTEEYATLEYLDCLFELENERVHWAVGNHDIRNGNMEWISEFTRRPTYYTKYDNGLQIVVINTCLGRNEPLKNRCEEMEEQYQMLKTVLDTVQAASHLILLSHHNVWGGIDERIDCEAANACALWNNFRCGQSSKFAPLFYEQLKAVRQRGIEVIAVAGDGGQKSKKYEYQDEAGIHFLVSGIARNSSLNSNPDSLLIFQHRPKTQELDWEFVNLDELTAMQKKKKEDCR